MCVQQLGSFSRVQNDENQNTHHHWKGGRRKHWRLIYLVAVHRPPQGGKAARVTLLGFPRRGEQEERTEETINNIHKEQWADARVRTYALWVLVAKRDTLWEASPKSSLTQRIHHYIETTRGSTHQVTSGSHPFLDSSLIAENLEERRGDLSFSRKHARVLEKGCVC